MPRTVKVKTVSVGLTPSEWRQLNELSKSEKVSRPEVLRELLRREVGKPETNGTKREVNYAQ